MSGIVFFGTADRERVVSFYRERLGFVVWREQDAGCTILQHDDLKLGFCTSEDVDTEGIVTLYYPTRDAVDGVHAALTDIADGAPRHNTDYDIYQFFAVDPDGRTLEFQTFLDEPAE
ncbi:VOC family protein [Halobacterium salinarum]|uniref:Uncharacterized protein (Non_TMPO_functional) n=1 Tax=Halobacterium salinarum (strain ATCC 33171 / DSM 3754 / JCM 8978 / NBRC 102687 / NCIMB 764 / 91-R6) TaxID=2597657 RepID=A0A4D6GWC2_HALS9|nr:VOC family protein [Halobacterium salinarum]MDL0124152.1 VOC family protein [Halobacterium salinarum]MDL0136139.1 VOC family protein [Halobacterium salinarum]MDL0144343.1 VOC family protein [Halobacterium salinarum]QCC44467.1 uncharacterized protein (non_TMPO_functional) [Halobacterium salinarum]TYO76485.1 hypothetical protein APQ99_01122 [Halobacterium salinarum DSM 3754]